MEKVAIMKTSESIILTYKSEFITFHKDHKKFKEIDRLTKLKNQEKLISVAFKKHQIKKYSDDNFNVNEYGEVFIKGDKTPVHKIIALKLLNK